MYRRYTSSEFETLRAGDGFIGRQLTVTFPSSNKWGFPDVKPYNGRLPDTLIGYNQMSRVKGEGLTAVHHYLSDSKFETVWSRPAIALTRLLEVGTSIGPDFSMFTDWPRMVQMWNWYRNCWCMALWQAEGLDVIPNVCWSTRASFAWCFDGLPKGSVLAVSSVGTFKYPISKRRFLEGYREMERRLEPTHVIFYGRVPEALKDRTNIKVYDSKWDDYYHKTGVM